MAKTTDHAGIPAECSVSPTSWPWEKHLDGHSESRAFLNGNRSWGCCGSTRMTKSQWSMVSMQSDSHALCSGHLAFVLLCFTVDLKRQKDSSPQASFFLFFSFSPRPLITSTNCSFLSELLFFVLAKHPNKTKKSRTTSFSAQFQRLQFLVTGICVPGPTAGQNNTVMELCGGCHGRQEASRMDLEGARARRCCSKDMLPMACFSQWVPISHDLPLSQMLSCYKSIPGWIHWLSQRPQDLITSPKHASCWKNQNTWSHNRQFTFKCNNLQRHLLVESLYCLHLVLKMVSVPPTSTTVFANSKQGNKKKKDRCTQDRKIHEQHLLTLGAESLIVGKVCIWLFPTGLSCAPLTSVVTDTLCP